MSNLEAITSKISAIYLAFGAQFFKDGGVSFGIIV